MIRAALFAAALVLACSCAGLSCAADSIPAAPPADGAGQASSVNTVPVHAVPADDGAVRDAVPATGSTKLSINPDDAAESGASSSKAVAAHLSAQDRQELDRIAAYINDLHTLKADVSQYGSDGSVRLATLFISRPGRMRLAYQPPTPSLIVADGTFLNFWDAEMQESSSTPIGSTLAAFLLRDNLKFGGDVTVTAVRHDAGLVEVTLAKTDAPEEGDFTLVFEEHPFALRQWRVRDAEGGITRVSLDNVQTGIALDRSLFYYTDPRFLTHQ